VFNPLRYPRSAAPGNRTASIGANSSTPANGIIDTARIIDFFVNCAPASENRLGALQGSPRGARIAVSLICRVARAKLLRSEPLEASSRVRKTLNASDVACETLAVERDREPD
jgi:hypothetical protein